MLGPAGQKAEAALCYLRQAPALQGVAERAASWDGGMMFGACHRRLAFVPASCPHNAGGQAGLGAAAADVQTLGLLPLAA